CDLTVALAVDDPALRENLAAHFRAAGADVQVTRARPGDKTPWPDARFAVLECSSEAAARLTAGEADAWPDDGPTPLTLVPSVDRKLLQNVAAATRGLALPAHVDGTQVLATIARRLGAKVPTFADAAEAPVLPDVRGARVLVADDDGLSRRYLEELLQRHGAQVTVCADGAQAVTLGRQVAFDAIFLDARMPELSGEDAARRLREFETNRRTPMIALTASALVEDRQRLKEAGFDECLLKPATVASLLGSVRRGLDSGPNGGPTGGPSDDHVPSPQAGTERHDSAGHPFTAFELCDELRRYRDAFASDDRSPRETAELAHRLRGAAAVSRLERVEARAADLEAAARAQHGEAMLLARSALTDTLDATIGSLAPDATR
ncbi:MAG: response regulator, partial [Pseudomonadota bacterium]